jgi:uncharacterized OB-fold protein
VRGALPEDWALPVVNEVNRAWFTSQELALQQCTACGRVQHPPEEICRVCGSMAFTTAVVPPTGTVYSYTVVHHPVNAALEAAVPYVVVLVSLDERPEVRVVGNLLDVDRDEAAIGLPVETVWLERRAEDGDTVWLPQWRRRAIVDKEAS